MAENTFLTALQKATSANLTIGELIDAATSLSGAGEPPLARQLYKVWINFNREHQQLYVAYFNCSALDSQVGDLAAAIESLKNAIALNPDFMPAYINLGGLLERSGTADRAVELWRSAVNRPLPVTGSAVGYVTTTLKQIARVLLDHQQLETAEAAVQQCLDINPQQSDLIEQYVALRLAQCKWPTIVPSERLDRKSLVKGIHPLSMSVYTDDPLLQLASAYRYAKSSAFEGPHNNPDSDRRHAAIDLGARRLRVGYVSSDLRDHAIGYLMAELFECHRKSDIEVHAYYCGPDSKSALTIRIKAAVEHWTDIRSLSDDEAARKIAADGIDILVDVNGHTRDSRTGIFARRPAPVQVNWLGYPGTMATPYHHYIIADDWIIPPGSEIYYSEKVVRLPCYQPSDRKRVVATERPARRDAGLPDGAFVFCCFNGTHKISRFTFERWLEILKRVPDSVLWLLDTSAETRNRLGEFAERNGVSHSRLVFAPKQHNSLHLARYPLADLFLDTAPYGAHTTASDALWMGVPVLTLSGRSFASRVCGSLVRAAGLTNLVCTRPEDYVDRAAALGNNRSEIESYKRRLEAGRNTCCLFDTDMLVDRLEEVYRTMCSDHQKSGMPRPDLSNLDSYLEVGIGHDHENQELLGIADYHGLYKAKLARLHLARPMRADERVWTAKDIALVEGDTFRQAAHASKASSDHTANMQAKRRMTGTR
jgi:predicted O-linked N-acetylglucosamine transferase (SPINDLY family)